MKIPEVNGDIREVAVWILEAGNKYRFPFNLDELDVLNFVVNQRYDGGFISVFQRYEITILYWQVCGYLRGE